MTDAGAPGCRGWPGRDLTAGVVAAVPVGRGDTVDSVLVVHTERASGIGELERAGLQTPGTTLGPAVEAVTTAGGAERNARLAVRVCRP